MQERPSDRSDPLKRKKRKTEWQKASIYMEKASLSSLKRHAAKLTDLDMQYIKYEIIIQTGEHMV